MKKSLDALKKLSKKELVELAKELQLKNYSRMGKLELVKAIHKAEKDLPSMNSEPELKNEVKEAQSLEITQTSKTKEEVKVQVASVETSSKNTDEDLRFQKIFKEEKVRELDRVFYSEGHFEPVRELDLAYN